MKTIEIKPAFVLFFLAFLLSIFSLQSSGALPFSFLFLGFMWWLLGKPQATDVRGLYLVLFLLLGMMSRSLLAHWV